ncbi:hypothetical protein EV424DRAFT_1340853 [Suillus variegatus]|nr:hypothetical protein EV424DRAFT_1340853 [Suillus variegatus]
MYGELAEEQEEADEPYLFRILGSPVSDSSAWNVAIPCGVCSSAGESAKERDGLFACVVPSISGLAIALGLIGMGEREYLRLEQMSDLVVQQKYCAERERDGAPVGLHGTIEKRVVPATHLEGLIKLMRSQGEQASVQEAVQKRKGGIRERARGMAG